MNLNLRFSSLMGACFLVAAAIVLAYLAGVMRGRASLADQTTRASVSVPVADKNTPRSENDKILAPEDLRYAAVLKERQTQQNKPLEPVKPLPEAPAGPPPRPADMKAGNLYDFVFQVATFKDEDSADALRRHLEGRALRTGMQRKGKALLVFVNFRGTEQRAEEIPRIMEELRLGKPLLLGKKSVASER